MASSFNQEKAIEQAFLQETAPGGGTSLQTLASLRAMQQFYKDTDDEYKALQAIAREEARYYIAGAMAIRNDPVLQQQLGTGASSAQKAGMLIKQRLGEKIFQDRLDGVIGDAKMKPLNLKRTEANFPKTSLIGRPTQ